jgi:hypothetical protein
MGPWRIAWLILAAAMASVYLGPSVALFAGYVDSCAWGLFLFGGAAFIVLSVFTFFCYIFVAPFPSFFRRDIIPSFFHRNKDGTPKVARTVSVSTETFANMENCYSRGITFWMIVIYPVLITMFIQLWVRGYEDYMNWRDPNDYGFYLYSVLFASLAIPWHLLYTWFSGRRCPYCLTPRTKDNFDSEHHVCLRCHTQFVAENETANEPSSPAPADRSGQ